jgi:hypothetical protein
MAVLRHRPAVFRHPDDGFLTANMRDRASHDVVYGLRSSLEMGNAPACSSTVHLRKEIDMNDRRTFLQKSSQLAAGAVTLGALTASASEAQTPAQTTPSKKLKIMMRSGWGTDDPTRGSFVFAHALAFADAGHDVQIFLTGESTYLMRKATVDAVKPIGWPPLSELMEKIVAKHIPVFS